MNSTESYTPEYVLRLRHFAVACDCPGCQQQPWQVTRRWQDEIRHSARPGCDRAAEEILCREDAFVLHSEMSVQPEAAALDPRQQAMNQAAINLAIASDAPPELILYALGVLIGKSPQLAEPQQISAFGDELVMMMQQGAMAEAFAQLPPVDTYKLAELQALSRRDLDASLDPLTGMTLVLKLNEINVMTPRYLQEMLSDLESDSELAAFMQSRRSVFINVLLYAFYHHVFPGADERAWEQEFNRLCQHFFSLKMLCGLFIQGYLVLDDETIAALFAAWHRSEDVRGGDNPLLAGISLLR
ncbi:hypothetical protein IBT47_07095 [Erwinia sp. S43]|uniref:hypothetical protein n=1 Tax=Erwinia sp. S43 TaxID=2769339 RepID=UPI00190C3793|nr:hypothetical protein [Erwinia sp. S43]MBK0032043.1 hypothetical protein [Erwinia sp. S43]